MHAVEGTGTHSTAPTILASTASASSVTGVPPDTISFLTKRTSTLYLRGCDTAKSMSESKTLR